MVDKIDYYLSVLGSGRRWRTQSDDDIEVLVEEDGVTVKRKISKRLVFVKEDVIEDIYDMCRGWFHHKVEIKDLLLQMNGDETIAFLEKAARHVQSRRTLDPCACPNFYKL